MTKSAAAALAAVSLVMVQPPAVARAGGWEWPVPGEVITPYRNVADPYAGGQHRGIDIAGRVGERVVAAAGGVVEFAGTAGWSGLAVTVTTDDGRYDTSYLHLSSVAVKQGERVASGDRVGAVGTTGRRSAERPHLHFGIRDAGTRHAYHDPLDFLPAPPPGRAPERPPPAPVPVGAPARPSPSPVRALRPLPAPHPPRARVPGGRRVPAPRRAPRGVPALRPQGVPAPALRPVRGAEPAAGRVSEPEAGAQAEPRLGRAPYEGAPAAARQTTGRPHGRSHPAHDGPNLGWAIACLGLLLAAASLGGTNDGRRTASAGRARLTAFLRPLIGRG